MHQKLHAAGKKFKLLITLLLQEFHLAIFLYDYCYKCCVPFEKELGWQAQQFLQIMIEQQVYKPRLL